MPLVKEGSGVVNDVCAQVSGLYVMLGIKNSDCRMARQAGHRCGCRLRGGCVSACVCVGESLCVVFACKRQGVRLKRQNGDLLVLYSCNLLRSDQPEPIMQH